MAAVRFRQAGSYGYLYFHRDIVCCLCSNAVIEKEKTIHYNQIKSKKMTTGKLLLQGALSFALITAGFSACTEKTTDKKEAPAAAASAENYPYTIQHPDNWEVGNTANTMTSLKCLKAWEEGKMDESMKYFADSVRVQFDGLDKKMSNDSLKAMFTGGWNTYKTVKIKMEDWESVISKDKTEEWTTLWYTQSWETKEGVKDSISVINDLQIKGGKVVRLSEHTRKLH